MIGVLSIVGKLFGHLQRVTGANLIDLNGPISIYRGDSAALRLTVTDDEDDRIDLTNYTIELQIKAARGAADPALVAKAVGTGITLLDQTEADTKGQADVAILIADMTREPGLYYISITTISQDGTDRQTLIDREFVILDVVNLP